MTLVETGKDFRQENVLSLRKKMAHEDINLEMLMIDKFLKNSGARKTGPVVTTTYSIEAKDGQPLLDVEILVPIDKKIELPSDYVLKPVFQIKNAVYSRHKGNPSSLRITYSKMQEYIKKNQLQQITNGYNVQIKDLMPGMEPDEAIVDIYIGVNPNIL